MANQEQLEILKQGIEKWNKWREENPVIEIDLMQAYFIEANLSKADLRRAFLINATFINATLIEANLIGANLIEANLRKANLRRAYLSEADLSEADLSEADLSGAKLSEANLSGAYLIEANLRRAHLRGAHLSGAKLSEANLSGANLSGANLSGANLIEANLHMADLSEANLSGANLSGAKLDDADLEFGILNDANLDRSSLISANLFGADMSGATMNHVNTSRWTIKGIKCTHIIRDDKRVDYAEGEFEKAYTQIENLVEMIIDLPFSDLTYYIGRFIENAMNRRFGEGALMLKNQEALSNDITKHGYVSFKEGDELHQIKNIVSVVQKELKPVIEHVKALNEPKPVIRLKDIDLKFLPLKIDTEELNRVLIDRYNQMSPLLQRILHTIQSVIQ